MGHAGGVVAVGEQDEGVADAHVHQVPARVGLRGTRLPRRPLVGPAGRPQAGRRTRFGKLAANGHRLAFYWWPAMPVAGDSGGMRTRDDARCATMRAAVCTRPGGPEVLEVRELPVPAVREGWSLVRVR